MVQAYQLVESAPSFTPLRFGLLSAAQVVDDPDAHWQQGTVMVVDLCDVPVTVTGGPCSTTSITKTPTVSGVPSTAAEPWSVYAWVDCAPIGQGADLADLRQRTERLLTNGEGRAVERVLWTGVASNGTVRPHLAADADEFAEPMGAQTVQLQSAATVLTGAAVPLVEGFALVEGALAQCYGGEGVIHVPAAAIAHLDQHGMLRQQGEQLRSLLGNIVAAYSSGDREGPTGANPATGEAWIYGTGAVTMRRSPIKRGDVRPGSFVGRNDNSTVYVVERTYVIDWSCCHLAAQVLIPGVAT